MFLVSASTNASWQVRPAQTQLRAEVLDKSSWPGRSLGSLLPLKATSGREGETMRVLERSQLTPLIYSLHNHLVGRDL